MSTLRKVIFTRPVQIIWKDSGATIDYTAQREYEESFGHRWPIDPITYLNNAISFFDANLQLTILAPLTSIVQSSFGPISTQFVTQ
jgi:hypothetical protein